MLPFAGLEALVLGIGIYLSAKATATRELVRRIEGSRAQVTCTRKTTPGLRALEKYAVRCGGGTALSEDGRTLGA